MKINGDDYQKLKKAIADVLESQGDLSDTYQKQGFSHTWFRWDMYHASGFRVGDGIGIIGDINIPDCADSHIDTALRKALRDHGIKEW